MSFGAPDIQHIGPLPILIPDLPGLNIPGTHSTTSAAGKGAQGVEKVIQGKSPLPSIGSGLADLLGLSGWGSLVVRGLEALAGAALILLGLQALTGGSGSPVEAVRGVRRMVP